MTSLTCSLLCLSPSCCTCAFNNSVSVTCSLLPVVVNLLPGGLVLLCCTVVELCLSALRPGPAWPPPQTSAASKNTARMFYIQYAMSKRYIQLVKLFKQCFIYLFSFFYSKPRRIKAFFHISV